MDDAEQDPLDAEPTGILRDKSILEEEDPLDAEPTRNKQVVEAKKSGTFGTASMESRSKLTADEWSDLENEDQLMPSIRGDDFDAFSPSFAGAPERRPGTLSGERISTLTGRLPIEPKARGKTKAGASTPPKGEAISGPPSEPTRSGSTRKSKVDIWGTAPKKPIRAKPRESRVSEGPPGFMEDTVRHMGRGRGSCGEKPKTWVSAS